MSLEVKLFTSTELIVSFQNEAQLLTVLTDTLGHSYSSDTCVVILIAANGESKYK